MLQPKSTPGVVIALGVSQTIAWASSYYLPAVLATPMARDLGVSPVTIFAAYSAALVVSAIVGPFGGSLVDRHGGKPVLVVSNFVFIVGLLTLAAATGSVALFIGWAILGAAMAIGLYEAAFATLVGLYGPSAKTRITGITLIAGFASTVGWPLSAFMDAQWGWRVACLIWAAGHLVIALPLNIWLPRKGSVEPSQGARVAERVITRPAPPKYATAILAFVFAVTLFVSTSMAAHLPRLLEAAGASVATAIAAGALIGPAQVAARLFEFTLLRKIHPLWTATAATLHFPVGATALVLFGGPAAFAFTILHGAGNGLLTIAKGTLPLALFGPIGYGARQGWMSAPGRVLQAVAPLLFAVALERYGASAIWLAVGCSLSAALALLFLRPTQKSA